ncbi:MAG: AIR synthase family protein [Peptostreptococcaceae bacterium]|jgi:hydrogenase expression/formation protein HypE|nr:AIR synthase family protein [Peptostreptococcaceae bacterium]
MQVGKLSAKQLNDFIFSKLNTKNKEVILGPKVGEDCSILDLGDNLCVMSTDPITGASKNIGKLAININVNDIASNGVKPIGVMVTLLLPESILEEELKNILNSLSEECDKLGIDILGGHTEITKAVNQPIINITAIGKKNKEAYYNKEEIKTGDYILITKGIGIEGCGIIFNEKEEYLKNIFTNEEIEYGKNLLDDISVLKEGLIGGKLGIEYMHDITEGGVLGALYEASNSLNKGLLVSKEDIYIESLKQKLCRHYNIDPLKLISSGSMLVIASKDKIEKYKEELNKENIKAYVIGSIVDEKGFYFVDNGKKIKIDEVCSDELYKVI